MKNFIDAIKEIEKLGHDAELTFTQDKDGKTVMVVKLIVKSLCGAVEEPRTDKINVDDITIDYARKYALKSGKNRGVPFGEMDADTLYFFYKKGYDEITRKCAKLCLDEIPDPIPDPDGDELPEWMVD